MRTLWPYLWKHRRSLFLALAMATVNQLCLMLDPLILRYILDYYALRAKETALHVFVKGISLGVLAMLASVFAAWIAKTIQLAAVQRVGHTVSSDIFTDGIRLSLRLPFLQFEQRRSGEMVGGLERLRWTVDQFVGSMINRVFASLLGVAFVLVYASRVHWVIAPAFLIIAPTLAAVSIALSARVKMVESELAQRSNQLSGNAAETFRNIELVMSLGIAEQQISRLDDDAKHILNLQLERVRRSRAYSFFQGLSVHLLRLGLLVLLLYLVFRQQITAGMFLSVYLYSYFVFGPMQEFGSIVMEYREMEASLNTFRDLKEEGKLLDQTGGVVLPALDSLSFEAVTFRYPTAAQPALDRVSFDVRRGEVIAFVGPSGAGKSTLVKLISALYLPAEGHVRFNGVTSRELGANALRMHIGLVTQDTQLFSGSIRDNLLMVDPDATDDALLNVLDQAAATPILERASDGLATKIGEGGMRLSGGERQRLAIARAFLRVPDLIILDEATSSLDSLVERDIANTLMSVARRRDMMTVMIAHRLSTVVRADRIYVLDQGAIAESGTHEQLLRLEGLYARLWNQQTNERMLVRQAYDAVT